MTHLRWWVEHGDAAEALKLLPDGNIDALVTDPPAGIGFMGKEWDGSKGGRDGDSGGASRFFYQAKPSTKERSVGLPDGTRNTHTTVKSISLMLVNML